HLDLFQFVEAAVAPFIAVGPPRANGITEQRPVAGLCVFTGLRDVQRVARHGVKELQDNEGGFPPAFLAAQGKPLTKDLDVVRREKFHDGLHRLSVAIRDCRSGKEVGKGWALPWSQRMGSINCWTDAAGAGLSSWEQVRYGSRFPSPRQTGSGRRPRCAAFPPARRLLRRPGPRDGRPGRASCQGAPPGGNRT